jgi:hypothetical protein
VEQTKEGSRRDRIGKVREGLRKDEWKKYVRKTKESIEVEEGDQRNWGERLRKREEEEWRRRMQRSGQSLGVYR